MKHLIVIPRAFNVVPSEVGELLEKNGLKGAIVRTDGGDRIEVHELDDGTPRWAIGSGWLAVGGLIALAELLHRAL
jgi:hypothetical protein